MTVFAKRFSIQKINSNISFKIFAAIEGKNVEESGISSYGIPYRIPYLKSRDKYAGGSHTLAKAWDFYSSIKKDLKEFDAIWCADVESFMVVLMTTKKPLLWDLHELPAPFMRNPILKVLFRVLERKVNVMVHANKARLEYLQEMGLVKYPQKQFYLRNYPQFNEIDTEYDDSYRKFEQWLGSDKCVYLQGLSGDKRADVESIQAVLAVPKLKVVVIGRMSDERMNVIEEKCGRQELANRVFFTGQIKQLKTPQYIRKCFMSLVFYKNCSANNWYCEPNRLFQNVLNGNPVVVGNNPPMKDFVESGGFGISVDTDGSDVSKIIDGINYVVQNYDSIKANIANNSGYALWDSQEETMRAIMEKFLE